MSRFRKFTQSLVAGYALLGVNLLYTLFSVGLAFRYLGKDEFGLWAVITQLAGYFALVDLGMSGSVARILVDYKDEQANGRYGSVLQTSFLVTLVQGVLILGVSIGLVLGVGTFPGVPEALTDDFRWLLMGQCALLAGSFLGRTFSGLLWAYQRTDLVNYSQIFTLCINFGVLWFCFHRGVGLYSMLWGQAAATLLGLLLLAGACARLKVFPAVGCWGRPTWTRFRELFSFGKDCFMVALGGQLINASQTILVAAYLGLEAAAVWTACTRTYNALAPLVMRALDFSAAGLSEMLVRGEQERFETRFRGITTLTAMMAVGGAVLFALCNQPFVHLWLGGKIGWSPWNDILLGIWSVLMAVQRCHCGLMGVRMKLGTVKYIYFIEGLVFVGLAVVSARWGGFATIITSSILATFCLSFLYGFWRTKTDFELSWSGVIKWHLPAIQLALVLIPLALALCWGAAFLPPVMGLGLMAGGIGLVSAGLVVRWGLDKEMRQRVGEKMPSWFAAWFR